MGEGGPTLTAPPTSSRRPRGTAFRRRLLAVSTMFVWAIGGAELILHGHTTIVLALAVAILALV